MRYLLNVRRFSEGNLVWSAKDIISELGIASSTIYRKLAAAGLPSEGLTTLQVVDTFRPKAEGNKQLTAERVKLIKAQRKEQELRNGMLEGALLDVAELRPALEAVFIAVRQIGHFQRVTSEGSGRPTAKYQHANP